MQEVYEDALLTEEESEESSDSYSQLVWQRFSRSKAAIVGGLMIVMLVVLAILPEFFSPYNLYATALGDSYTPPTQIRFFDLDGNFSLRPFVYKQELEIDPVTYQARPKIDPDNRYNVQFFVRSWEYELFGLDQDRPGISSGWTPMKCACTCWGRTASGAICGGGFAWLGAYHCR